MPCTPRSLFLHYSNVENPSDYLVRCGEWDTKSDSEPLSHQDRRIGRITLHPSYKNTRYYDNNVALLHVEKDFRLDEHISPICLPDEAEGERSYRKTGCKATGWGTENFGETPNIPTGLLRDFYLIKLSIPHQVRDEFAFAPALQTTSHSIRPRWTRWACRSRAASAASRCSGTHPI